MQLFSSVHIQWWKWHLYRIFRQLRCAQSTNSNFRVQSVRISNFAFLWKNRSTLLHSIAQSRIRINHLVCVPLDETRIKCIQKILKSVETLQIKNCTVEGDFHQNVMKYCKQLKRLYIKDADFGRHRYRQYQPRHDSECSQFID